MQLILPWNVQFALAQNCQRNIFCSFHAKFMSPANTARKHYKRLSKGWTSQSNVERNRQKEMFLTLRMMQSQKQKLISTRFLLHWQ